MAYSTVFGADYAISSGTGIRTPAGVDLSVPPGARVAAYVRSTGVQSGDEQNFNTAMLVTTINAGLLRCRAGYGDIVLVLPGHTEAVGTTMMTSAPAGSRIIGCGQPDQDDAPTLNWSAATSNLAVSMKNITIANLRLVANADDITKGITVTGAGFKLLNNYVVLGSAAAKDFATFLSVETGGDNALIAGNTMIGTAGTSTAISKPASNTIANLRIKNNRIVGITAAAGTGLIAIAGATTAVVTNVLIEGNYIETQTASGTAAVTFTDIAHTGVVMNNIVGSVVDAANVGAVAATGITLAGTTNILVHFAQNYHSDGAKGTSGALTPAVTS